MLTCNICGKQTYFHHPRVYDFAGMSFIPKKNRENYDDNYRKCCKLCNNGINCQKRARKNGLCDDHNTLLLRVHVDTTRDSGKVLDGHRI